MTKTTTYTTYYTTYYDKPPSPEPYVNVYPKYNQEVPTFKPDYHDPGHAYTTTPATTAYTPHDFPDATFTTDIGDPAYTTTTYHQDPATFTTSEPKHEEMLPYMTTAYETPAPTELPTTYPTTPTHPPYEPPAPAAYEAPAPPAPYAAPADPAAVPAGWPAPEEKAPAPEA